MADRGELDKLCYLWDECKKKGIPENLINRYLWVSMNGTRSAFRNEYGRNYPQIAFVLYQWDVARKAVNKHARA